MKRLLPFAVLLVIGLLVAQPVLSSLTCAAGMAAPCAPSCPMAMTGMATDCPMHAMTSIEGCPQNCCSRNSVEAVPPKTAPEKAKIAIFSPVAELPSAIAAPNQVKPAVASIDVRSSSLPRYIVNHVFRI